MRCIKVLRATCLIPLLAFATATLLPAWTMSVEFPYSALPRPVWEHDLTLLKAMGVAHISLPPPSGPAANSAPLDEAIRLVRALGLDADLEGALPQRLRPLAKSHGGPLTDAPADAVHIPATMPRALENERKLLTGGIQEIIWTDVFDTLIPAYRQGVVTLAGGERPGAALIRREAQLARFWRSQLSALPELKGARLATPARAVSVHQYVAARTGSVVTQTLPAGLSLATVANDSPEAWKGEIRVLYPALQRPISLPPIAIPPYDALWLPVDIPLTAGPLCTGCTGFSPRDHLAWATAELTDMEYENGVLAMEFIASSPGEVVLQLSREPIGPLIAAGRPVVFDWDAKTQRARLPIPAGNAKTGRVRVALAIDAPAATAFFGVTPVLILGETNPLTAEFSPPEIAARSRLRTPPGLTVSQDAPPPRTEEDKDKPALITYRVTVPADAIPGDSAELAIEADGSQLSHAQARILPAAAFTFEDAVSVRVAKDSALTLEPATIPVNQKPGREIVVSLRNNAPEIRTFELEFSVPGLDFSPAKMNVSVGASVARELTFRVFSSAAAPGIHEGEVKLSGAATAAQPVRFLVLPQSGAIAWSDEGFSILESAKLRASFLGDRWLEMIDKASGADSQPAGGTIFHGGPLDSLKLEDLAKPARPKQSR